MAGVPIPEIPMLSFVEWIQSGSEVGNGRGVTIATEKPAAKERRGIASLMEKSDNEVVGGSGRRTVMGCVASSLEYLTVRPRHPSRRRNVGGEVLHRSFSAYQIC